MEDRRKVAALTSKSTGRSRVAGIKDCARRIPTSLEGPTYQKKSKQLSAWINVVIRTFNRASSTSRDSSDF